MSQTRSGAAPRAIASARASISASAAAYCVSPGVTTHSTGGPSPGASKGVRGVRRELNTRPCIKRRGRARARRLSRRLRLRAKRGGFCPISRSFGPKSSPNPANKGPVRRRFSSEKSAISKPYRGFSFRPPRTPRKARIPAGPRPPRTPRRDPRHARPEGRSSPRSSHHIRPFLKSKYISHFSSFSKNRNAINASGPGPRVARNGLSGRADGAQPVACITLFSSGR